MIKVLGENLDDRFLNEEDLYKTKTKSENKAFNRFGNIKIFNSPFDK